MTSEKPYEGSANACLASVVSGAWIDFLSGLLIPLTACEVLMVWCRNQC